MNDVEQRVREILRRTEAIADVDSLTPDQSLYASGLDSLGTVELVFVLEEDFGLTLPPTPETLDGLDTIAGIVGIVGGQRP